MDAQAISRRPVSAFLFHRLSEGMLFRLILLAFLSYLLLEKDIRLEFNLSSLSSTPALAGQSVTAHKAGFGPFSKASSRWPAEDRAMDARFHHLSFVLSPDLAGRKGVPATAVRQKRQRIANYLDVYAPLAIRQMREYGIPASITLAQALLESNVGASALAVQSNNHFGIKCRRKCRGCTCRNYADDDAYDMFRVFGSAADSYREHAKLLTGSRYRHLLQLPRRDYRAWARGLKKAGYATDPHYAEKLIRLIRDLQLHRYDIG